MKTYLIVFVATNYYCTEYVSYIKEWRSDFIPSLGDVVYLYNYAKLKVTSRLFHEDKDTLRLEAVFQMEQNLSLEEKIQTLLMSGFVKK